MDRLSQSTPRGRPVTSVDAAKANDVLEHFISSATLKTILGNYRNICELLHLKPNVFPLFYPKLKANLNSWKAKALWKKFDARASHKCYARGKVCPNTRVLIIGAGPCGLRTAIEAQLLGAKVVVIEKRDRISRNNVLHLWPFVIEDLRALGAKKFFGKFCAGAIDHISIRQLQCILLKVALLLGVEIHTELSFEKLVEPSEKTGWRAEFKPTDHPVSQYEFDVIIGADGKRNTLQGFKRKEFRGKLAIAITANFINKRTEAEACVEEISGVAFIFNQKFFKELNAETGIDLENIVYYKDDTHYFVMTAKKPSLIDKGVIKQDYSDTARLLSPDNVDRENLMEYAREAAEFSTNYQMPDLEFAVNHYGQPDVAMFDFTSMYAAENASKVIERHGYKLLMILVGDSLLEPFWPTGSGCARGFLSSLDACWAIKAWGSGSVTPLEVLAERESIYRLLAQTTPENLSKDCKSYTVDPSTRYPNLNRAVLLPQQVLTLFDSDDPSSIEFTSRTPQPIAVIDSHRKRRRRDSHLDPNTLISWIREQIKEYDDLTVNDITTSFKDGRVLCAILHHYRPDLLDYSAIKAEDVAKNNQLVFDLLEKEIGISPVMTGEDIAKAEIPDYLAMFSYLTLIYDTFRGEIPHIKHPKLDLPEPKENVKELFKGQPKLPMYIKETPVTSSNNNHLSNSRIKRHAETVALSKPSITTDRKTKKRKSLERYETNLEERRKRLEEIATNRADRQNKRRQQRRKQTEQFIKSMQMLHMNAKPDSTEPFEDYSLFVYRQTAPHFQDRVKNLEKQFIYVPDRENRLRSQTRGAGADEEFAARIKDLEDKWRDPTPAEKKPKDLMRAIGKIETTDWNIKEIEKKIMENKLGKSTNKEKERVPKWNREQFLARQTKMEKQHLNRQNSEEAKYMELDKGIKHLEQRLKEGSVRDVGKTKVAKITEKLTPKNVESESKLVPQSNSKSSVILPTQSRSEFCHFCKKRVYLMERVSAEGRFFHRGCFKCQYCFTNLRVGSYMFDRDGQYGHRFYCMQHYGMPGEIYGDKIEAKSISKLSKENVKPLETLKTTPLSGVEGVDLLDRVQTPERIEFANLSAGHISSDHDESLSQMDEDEWTDRNFGASTAEVCSSDEDEDTSSLSGSESDNEDAYEEALEEPPTKEGTLRWMERYKQRYSKQRQGDEDSESDDYTSSSDHSSYYENSSGDEEDGPVTEGEEEIRARELRKQEVRVDPPVVQTDTGSDTEIVSESSSETSSKHNSATEISTDSEFAVDEPTPTREIPSIVFNDFNVTKTRGNYGPPKKVQVKSSVLQTPMNGKSQKKGIKLEFTPLVPSPVLPKPAPSLLNRTEGYALNRTQSTGGIATKVSLELKKKYLLGEDGIGGNIQKSGSVSTLDSKFKSFHTNITDCQKMLKPASETSSNIQVFSGKLNERSSPLSPILSQSTSHKSSDIVSPVSSSDNKVSLPKDLPLTLEQLNNSKKDVDKGFVHELEGRPRSPVQDIPIIVPQVNWSQTKNKGDDISSDSLTTSDTDSDEHTGIQKSPTVKIFENIPTVKVHTDSGEILQFAADSLVLDSLSPLSNQPIRSEIQTPSLSEPPKSISSERKVLNQPKTLPNIQNDGILPNVHNECHERALVSGQSTPSDHDSCIENTGAAMTETELSDWARDSAVSDDFEDVEFDFDSIRRNKQPKALKSLITNKIITKAYMEEFEDTGHVCGKGSDHLSSILNSIEFMDTGEETSSDEKVLVEASLKNNGYMEFHNEDDIVEDSLNPNINNIIETVNPEIRETLNLEELSSLEKNTGYCIIGDDNQILKIKELEKSKEKLNENEEDSLLIVETGTTTEENTQSDITVKNMVKDTIDTSDENKASDEQEKDEYQEHCQRLQSKVIFSNVRDSIDIRKSKRKDKSDTIAKPDLIQEEISSPQQNLQSNFSPKSLKNIYTKEEIQKVRDENQRLVQEMVMNKMKAQNRSLERKKRNRNSFSPSLSPNRLFNLSKSATADLSPNKDNISVTPDVLLVNHTPLEKSQTMSSINDYTPHRTPKHKPNLVLHSSFSLKPSASEAFSLPDIQQALKIDPNRTAEKLKENARLKAQLMSNEELGLSPEDKLKKLKERIARRIKEKEAIDVQDNIESLVLNTERRNSVLYSNDTLAKKRSNKNRPKSVSEMIKPQLTGFTSIEQNKLAFCKSDPNLLTEPYVKVEKKLKNKDRERRKSITKMISEFFGKKKEGVKSPNNSTAKGFLSRISPKSKSKSMINLARKTAEKPAVELLRTNSFSEIQCRKLDNISPPPIPPLPLHYTNSGPSHFTDESSDGEHDWKCPERSSCDTLDQSVTQEGRRISKTARKAARQAQLKRHRMAQEIQRKLEETEVKTRELEQRGVTIEKVFRGESVDINCPVEEADLLKDWFDLMRDLTELRRYERELLVRAQELELEDRHARLQQELRERLDNDEQKTKEDIKTESSIINEMMEIVAKRDSLIALLEQDRLRYSEEDRDFEEQMLTKDLRLTPLQKSSVK